MNASEKHGFAVDLIDSVRDTILAAIPHMPEDWDGHELRHYIAAKFASQAYIPLKGKMLRDFTNEMTTNNRL